MTEFRERSIVVLGGAGVNSIGLEIVADSIRDGVENVFIGTRNLENYNKALNHLGRRNIDTSSGVYPFIADLTRTDQIEQAANEVINLGIVPTDLIFSQAGGMEGFTAELFSKHLDPISAYTFQTPIEELDLQSRRDVDQLLKNMRDDLMIWTEEAMPAAIAVNYQATFDTIEIIASMFNHFNVMYLNSDWGHKSGEKGVEIPLVYRPVDRSKAMVRDRLREEGQMLRKEGIPTCELTASLVNDTRVGKMFNDFFLNLMDSQQRDAIKNSSILRSDVSTAARNIFKRDSATWPKTPWEMFVYRREGRAVLEASLKESSMYHIPYRF